MTSEILQCPTCGRRSFSWSVTQIQFGNVHRYEDGSIETEGMKMGDIVDSNTGKDGVWCDTCKDPYELEELVSEPTTKYVVFKSVFEFNGSDADRSDEALIEDAQESFFLDGATLRGEVVTDQDEL